MISIKEMRKLEENCGIPKLELMESAGKGIFEILNKKFDLKNKRILVVAYHGNNGGDGFVAARYLAEISEVDVLFLGEEQKLKYEAKTNYKKIINDYKIQFINLEQVDFSDYDIIIDAILGIGIVGNLREKILGAINEINKTKTFKVSVDVPSGMNPDTGEIKDSAVNSDLIITFHDIKKGLDYVKNKVQVVDIGIKKKEAQD